MPQFDSIRFQSNRPLLKEVSADRLNAILSEIKKSRPRGERGITVRHTGDGTFIGIAQTLKSGGAAGLDHPFRIFAGDQENTIKVDPGTLNGIIAQNWTQQLSVAPGLSYVTLTASCAGNRIISTQLSLGDTAPEEPEPIAWSVPSTFSVALGMVQIIDDALQIWQIVYDNLAYAAVKRITTNVGTSTLPYTNYYTWAPS